MTLFRGSMQILSRQRVVGVIAQTERNDSGVNGDSTVIAWPSILRSEVNHALNHGAATRCLCYITLPAILTELVRSDMAAIANRSHLITMKRSRPCRTGTRLSARIWSGRGLATVL